MNELEAHSTTLLPKEIWVYILEYLSFLEALHLQRVDKNLLAIVTPEMILRKRWQAHFLDNPKQPLSRSLFVETVQEIYSELTVRCRHILMHAKEGNITALENLEPTHTELTTGSFKDWIGDIFYWAKKNKHQVILDYFFKVINERPILGYEPQEREIRLRLSIACNKTKMLEEILESATPKFFKKALFTAVEYNNKDALIKILALKDASIDVTIEGKTTLLHKAISKNHFEIVKFLLDQKVNINARDNMGFTPLHYAIDVSLEMVEYLLQKNADVHLTDIFGETALTQAHQRGNAEIIVALEKATHAPEPRK